MRRSHFGKLKVIAEPLSMRILLLLKEQGPLAVGEITDAFRCPPVKQPSVSMALKKLRACGLVRVAKDGGRARYEVNVGVLNDVMDHLQGTIGIPEEIPEPLEPE